MANNKRKGMNPVVGIIIILLVAALGAGGGFFLVNNLKSDLASKEASLPESAISTYLNQVKANDFDGIYENSLTIDPHLNSKEDYANAISNIYADVNVNDVIFQQDASDNTLYNLYYNNALISSVKVMQTTDGSYLASTIFKGDNNYTVEIPTGSSLSVNGINVDSTYMTTSNTVASNFLGLSNTSDAPKVDVYTLTNLISEPTLQVNGSEAVYNKSVLNDAYYVGTASTDPNLQQTFMDYAITLASYPANESSLGAVRSITVSGSDFYDRIGTLQTQWYSSHSQFSFSNVSCTNIVMQSDDTAIGNVSYDLYVKGSENDRTYHGGIQLTLINVNGSWKIAGTGIDLGLNPNYTQPW